MNELAKYRYRSGGDHTAKVVIRTPVGGGIRGGHYHSQHPEAAFIHVAGLKVVIPSNPHDAKGLLLAAIRDPDPVIFFEPKRVYRAAKGDVPEGEYTVPLETASVVRPGRHVTVLGYGAMLYEALDAAAKAAEKGVEAEVIDLRSLRPLDAGTIGESVARTGRLVVVEEGPPQGGYAAEVVALAVEAAGPIAARRVTMPDLPMPFAPTLEAQARPDAEDVTAAVRSLLEA
ncbi:MAG: hypothetical protein M3O25_02905 [Actinomycetota bacterium]|nr:hypothetical protein [Actinomycetota bacterium]